MVLTPFADADTVNEFSGVGVIDVFGKVVDEFFVAFLKFRVIRIGRPHFHRTGLRGIAFCTVSISDIERSAELMFIAAVYAEAVTDAHVASAGLGDEAAVALRVDGVAAVLPDVHAVFRVELSPGRADEKGLGIVGGPDCAGRRRHVVIPFPEVVQIVAEPGIKHPAAKRVWMHDVPIRREVHSQTVNFGIALLYLTTGCRCKG